MVARHVGIGKPETRQDGWAKAKGEAIYVNDVSAENLHYAVALRSVHHHALITQIDVRNALGVEGVTAILTAKDVPGNLYFGVLVPDRPVLADGRVRFIGEPVALVIARDLQAARRARDAIKVEYEGLNPVFDPIEALSNDAPRIHKAGNELSHLEVSQGDIELGFAEADVVLDETFYVPRVYHGYLETEASTAVWHNDGTLTVWASTQQPFNDRVAISQVLGIGVEKVRVRVPAVGGAFGGKEDSSLHILAALGAWKIKGAVRPINQREDSFLAHPKRHPAVLHYRVGAKRDGTLTALRAVVHLDTGAYASWGPAVGQMVAEIVPGPYRIPHVKTDTYVVYTNSPIGGAMRGFGSPQPNFAYESLMDMLAEELGIGPSDLRRKNVFQPGDRAYTQVKVNQAQSLAICLEKAVEERERLRKLPASPGKVSGVGLALGMQTMGLGFRITDDSGNCVEWLPDGNVLVRLGAPEIGQGLSTVAAQITGEALGINSSQVEVADVDTVVSPNGGPTCASRMTYLVGNSLLIAGRKAVDALLEEAARSLEVPKAMLRYEQGYVYREDSPEKPPFLAAEFASRAAKEGRTIQGLGMFSFPYGKDTPDHLPIGMPHVLFCFGAQVVRVEVDPELGTVDVKELVAIHDVGKIINRIGVEGQIEGAVAMGMGYALMENMSLKQDGRWVTDLAEYLMPTSTDVPWTIKTVILEVPEESGPYGAKGVGEIGTVPTAAAIANAVYDAVGVRVKSIPIRPDALIRE